MDKLSTRIGALQKQVDALNSEISSLRSQMQRCQHTYGKGVYDPETHTEPSGSRLVGQGSDVWFEPTGYTKVKKDRWSRECTICGKKDYTYEKQAVVSSYEPKFK